ncbi:MAG: hypothetical protein NTX63_01105 [Candidatus Peregrinibacteria bacterium]|nr:hypothetical protein [Candidatus Peregrinibacteria bacterium]
MARMAILQTELTDETIHPDELAGIPGKHEAKYGENIVRGAEWIGFNGTEPFTGGYANFGRSIGLNTQSGRLHVGNIQDEAPLEYRLEDLVSWEWSRLRYTDKIGSRNPMIMELERLARENIGRIELIDVENDGTPNSMSAGDKGEFERWRTKYLTAVEQSKTGKPRIEEFYKRNMEEGRYLSPRQLRILFGERIDALMRRAS